MMPESMSHTDLPARLVDQGAYRSWRSARVALSQSIQAYARSSNALGSSLIHAGSQHLFSHYPHDQTSAEFDAELDLFDEAQGDLQIAHTRLLMCKNQSCIFSPINRLSVEVLSMIFHAASLRATDEVDSPTSPSFLSPERIAGVCQTWREIALAHPSLWSRLGLIIRRPTITDALHGNLQLRIERSLNLALDLNLWVEKDHADFDDVEWGDGSLTGPTREKLIEISSPLASRIQHLDIDLGIHSDLLLHSLLALFAKLGASSIPSLILRCSHRRALYSYLAPELEPENHSIRTKNRRLINDLLYSVRYLSLLSVRVSWNNKAYHNLASLELSDSDAELDLTQMAAILTSSPALHTLSITNTSFRDIVLSEPVDLPNLRHLTLGECHMSESDISYTLALIGACSSNLNLHLTTGDYRAAEDLERYRSFFERSRLRTLHINVEGSATWFELLQECLDDLEALTLEHSGFRDSDLKEFIEGPEQTDEADNLHEPSNSEKSEDLDNSVLSNIADNPNHSEKQPPWPKLNALYLKDCYIHTETLLSLLRLHNIKLFESFEHYTPWGPDPSALKLRQDSIRKIIDRAYCLGEDETSASKMIPL